MLLHKEITDKILKCFYEVYNTLGYGFLEKVYENALCLELKNIGLKCKKQHKIDVNYKDENVGKYFADLIIDDKVIIELKASPLIEEHEYKLLNYLKATNIEVSLLLGLGKEPQFLRRIFTNDRKSDHLK